MNSFLLTVISVLWLLVGVSAFNDGTPLILAPCKQEPAQVFKINNADKTLRCLDDNKCMDVAGYNSAVGSVITDYTCHTEQKDPKLQNQEFTNKDNTTFVLDMGGNCIGASYGGIGARVQLAECGSPLAQWSLQFVNNDANSVMFQMKNPDDPKAPAVCIRVGAPFSGNPCNNTPFNAMPFCDTSKGLQERVDDLVSRMTLHDKVNLLGHDSGMAYSVGISPYYWVTEALHGVVASFSPPFSSASSFPQVILTGATFDADIFRRLGRAIALEGRVLHNNNRASVTFWTPNVNIFRDPRWGRGQETPGEDPYLTSVYAKTFVRAFQFGDEDKDHLLASACCKHYAAYSQENGGGVGRDAFNAVVTDQDFADTYTPAFEACARKEGGAASGVMCSYNAVNGVPSCANEYILTDVLRSTWGFDGYVTSDCGATDDVQNAHHYTNNTDETCHVTMKAGMDLDCGSYLQSHTVQGYANKVVTDSDVNGAMNHTMRVRMRLGMFDPEESQPYNKLPTSIINSQDHQNLALEVAQKGIVLLENHNGTLPLSLNKIHTVALIGPSADDGVLMQGNYYGTAPFLITPRQALETKTTVKYAKGSERQGSDTSGIAEACAAASSADAVVLVLGLDGTMENEGNDRSDLDLPAIQKQLFANVSASAGPNTPVIVVVMSGGPVDLSTFTNDPRLSALLWAGYPGQAGGQAIVDILFGDVAPSGRLPYTVYKSDYAQQVKITDMGMRPNSTTGNVGRGYRFFTGTAVYPFGFGRSYTTFRVSANESSAVTVNAADISADLTRLGKLSTLLAQTLVTASFTIQNTGTAVTSDYTALAFLSGPNAGVDGRPIRTLVGFQRVGLLAPGRSASCVMNVTSSDLSRTVQSGERVAEAGTWTLMVEDQTVKINVH
eukprot:PhM_4_TR5169/c2_g1_i1/m.79931